MRSLTKEEAIELAKSEAWKGMSLFERAFFQLHQDRLCMPFDVFQEAVEKSLGRPVFTHEFGLNADGLKKEICGERAAPTWEEIVAMIPAEKRIIIDASRQE